MRHWLIYCPEGKKPVWVTTSDDRDDLDALVAYHGEGTASLLAMTAWLHVAREVAPHELSQPGFQPAPSLRCPHTPTPALQKGADQS